MLCDSYSSSCWFSLVQDALFLKSRYAMDDKVYAKKYRKGVSKVDLLGKLKQASDARHTQYLTGYTLGGGGCRQAS